VADTARAWRNRALIAVTLLVVLPSIAIAERLRAGAGRRVAHAAILRLGRACGIRFEIEGTASLDLGVSHVFIANHASPLDIPAMLIARPDARFLAAAELFRVPLLGSALRALGSVPVDRGNPVAARRALAALSAEDEPTSIVVFAEGGIPPNGQQPRFKSGAFVLAIDTGASVVPVSILGSADVLARRARLLARPGTVRVLLHDPIATAGLGASDRKSLRDQTETTVRAAMEATS
jgi:1-acyl-sn-glycerol-3-phosphate acyltransferase